MPRSTSCSLQFAHRFIPATNLKKQAEMLIQTNDAPDLQLRPREDVRRRCACVRAFRRRGDSFQRGELLARLNRRERRAAEISAYDAPDAETLFDLDQVGAEVLRSRAHEDDMQCADVGTTERQNTSGHQRFCSLNSVRIVNDRQRYVKTVSPL